MNTSACKSVSCRIFLRSVGRFFLSALALSATATSVFAEESAIPEWVTGKAILDHYETISTPSNTSSGTLQSAFTLYTRADPKFSETLSARFELRGTLFRKSIERENAWILRGDAKEASLDYRSQGWDFRAGQILTPWGRSDAVNPTDYLTAKDYTYLSSHDEVRRIGAPGARLSFVPNGGNSPLEFIAAWNARFPQSKMLIPREAIPAGLNVQTEPETPKLFARNQEVAVKASYLASSWDASLSAFDGYSHFGQFVWDGQRVRLEYLPVRAVGGDFSVTFDAFVLRGESAYYFYDLGSSGLGGLSLTEPNHWDSVLGIERPFGERFRVLVQLLYRRHAGLTDSQTYVGSNATETAIVRGIGRANALIQNYQETSKLGATFLVQYDSEGGDWHAEVGGIGNFIGGGDYVIRPKVSRKLTDSLRVTAGLDYYGGPVDEPLGALRGYRSVFAEGMMSF